MSRSFTSILHINLPCFPHSLLLFLCKNYPSPFLSSVPSFSGSSLADSISCLHDSETFSSNIRVEDSFTLRPSTRFLPCISSLTSTLNPINTTCLLFSPQSFPYNNFPLHLSSLPSISTLNLSPSVYLHSEVSSLPSMNFSPTINSFHSVFSSLRLLPAMSVQRCPSSCHPFTPACPITTLDNDQPHHLKHCLQQQQLLEIAEETYEEPAAREGQPELGVLPLVSSTLPALFRHPRFTDSLGNLRSLTWSLSPDFLGLRVEDNFISYTHYSSLFSSPQSHHENSATISFASFAHPLSRLPIMQEHPSPSGSRPPTLTHPMITQFQHHQHCTDASLRRIRSSGGNAVQLWNLADLEDPRSVLSEHGSIFYSMPFSPYLCLTDGCFPCSYILTRRVSRLYSIIFHLSCLVCA